MFLKQKKERTRWFGRTVATVLLEGEAEAKRIGIEGLDVGHGEGSEVDGDEGLFDDEVQVLHFISHRALHILDVFEGRSVLSLLVVLLLAPGLEAEVPLVISHQLLTMVAEGRDGTSLVGQELTLASREVCGEVGVEVSAHVKCEHVQRQAVGGDLNVVEREGEYSEVVEERLRL